MWHVLGILFHSFLTIFEYSILIKRWCWHAPDEQLHRHWQNVKCLHSTEMAELLKKKCFYMFLHFLSSSLCSSFWNSHRLKNAWCLKETPELHIQKKEKVGEYNNLYYAKYHARKWIAFFEMMCGFHEIENQTILYFRSLCAISMPVFVCIQMCITHTHAHPLEYS